MDGGRLAGERGHGTASRFSLQFKRQVVWSLLRRGWGVHQRLFAALRADERRRRIAELPLDVPGSR